MLCVGQPAELLVDQAAEYEKELVGSASLNAMSDFEPTPGVPLPPEQKAIADAILAESVADIGAPTLALYHEVYDNLGLPWPGDEGIRRLYPVADGALTR